MSTSPVENAIENTGWSDATLHGLWWENNSQHLVLRMRQLGTTLDSYRDVCIVCTWPWDVDVSLLTGGPPMTWDADFTRAPDGTWSVHLDFASAGDIRLSCTAIELRPADGPTGTLAFRSDGAS